MKYLVHIGQSGHDWRRRGLRLTALATHVGKLAFGLCKRVLIVLRRRHVHHWHMIHIFGFVDSKQTQFCFFTQIKVKFKLKTILLKYLYFVLIQVVVGLLRLLLLGAVQCWQLFWQTFVADFGGDSFAAWERRRSWLHNYFWQLYHMLIMQVWLIALIIGHFFHI